MPTFKLLPLAALALTAACEGAIIDANTDSGFVTPSATGVINNPAVGGSRGFIDSSGSGYVFKAGTANDGDIVAVSGIIPGTTASAVPTSGSTIYSGSYAMVHVDGFFISDDNVLVGFPEQVTGAIALNANFDDRTLTGSADDLSVNGRFSGNTLTGRVTYDGVSGNLRGVIGGDKAVGAFHGNDEDEIYAGGFYVTPEP